jgi:putative transposase
MNKNTLELIPGYFYHIFNRGINKEKIFFKEENYYYFLKKYNEYFSVVADTYSYCLLSNHFHLLVRIKDKEIPSLKEMESLNKEKTNASEQLRRFFISYSMSINKQEDRKGSLFIKNFKRKAIIKDNYLVNLIFYIHHNPVHHKLTTKIENYKWSSYLSILSDKPSKLVKDYVLAYFGGKERYKEFHEQIHKEKEFESFLIE